MGICHSRHAGANDTSEDDAKCERGTRPERKVYRDMDPQDPDFILKTHAKTLADRNVGDYKEILQTLKEQVGRTNGFNLAPHQMPDWGEELYSGEDSSSSAKECKCSGVVTSTKTFGVHTVFISEA